MNTKRKLSPRKTQSILKFHKPDKMSKVKRKLNFADQSNEEFSECRKSIDESQIGKYYCVYFDEGRYWGRLLKVIKTKLYFSLN